MVDIDGISEREGTLGYWLDRAAWGRGYAFEAAHVLTRFGFEDLGLTRLKAGHAYDNPGFGSGARQTRLPPSTRFSFFRAKRRENRAARYILTSSALGLMALSECWEAHASQWIEWALAVGHDSYWRFHRDQFLHLLPPPGRRTIDIGCGEGWLTGHLMGLGHQIVGVDTSPSLVAAARELDPSMDVRLADAAALPLDDASADLAIAFMSLHDIDPMPAAMREIARVLEPGGQLRLARVLPH